MAENMVSKLEDILGQCDSCLDRVELDRLRVPERLLDFEVGTAHTLTTAAGVKRTAAYLVGDTRRVPAFEAEAFGRGSSGPRTWLTDTVWLTVVIDKPELALVHELFHV